MKNTVDLLRDILVRDYKLDTAGLTENTPLEELGIDSLGLAELLFSVEDELGISLSGMNAPALAAGAPRLQTVGDVVRCVEEALVAETPTKAEIPAIDAITTGST